MATTAARRQLLKEILEEIAADDPGKPVPITDGERMIGFFFPIYVSARATPPNLSPEHWAELKRRHESRDDEVSGAEMIDKVMKGFRQSGPKP